MNSLMQEQETLQQEMRLKHKQDSEADTLAQPRLSVVTQGQLQQPSRSLCHLMGVPHGILTSCNLNHWGEPDKAHLTISLREPTTGVLSSLPPKEHHNYGALTAALEIRFGAKHQVELNRMRLRSRTRRRGEGLPELAEDIERLTRLAYLDAPATMIEVLA